MSYIGNEPIVSATRTITETTATAGQTVFVANGGYTVGFIDVFVNGAQLQTSDFTATNGCSITLNSPATIGDDIRLVAWGTFNTSSTYTQSATDALLATKVNTSVTTAFKNRIINGDMRIDQRNAGASVTAGTSSLYTVDRWKVYGSQASKFTAQQSTTAPAGFTHSLKITSSSAYSVVSTDIFQVWQNIEGLNVSDFAWGTASARAITFSFRVQSSLTGTFAGWVSNDAGNRSYPFTYTISSANTFETKTITIPGDTSGTWLTNNGVGMTVALSMGAGSSFNGTANAWNAGDYRSASGSTSIVGTSGATFYLTGVQLEVGSSATPFDTRAYGTELALCQRYLPSWAAGQANGAGIFGSAYNTTNVNFGYQYIVPPRTSPTGATVSGTFTLSDGNNTQNTTAVTFGGGGICSAFVDIAGTGLTQYRPMYFYGNSSAKILFTGCEL